MASRYYRDRLESVLGTADEDSLAKVSNNWLTHSMLLDEVAKSVRKSGQKLDSEIEGEAGVAMVAKFNAISDKLELDSADMKKGSGALGLAQSAALEAIKARNGIQLSGPMNQMPTKPEGPTPGTQATPEQETAMATYNAGVTQYLQNEQMHEDNARKALEQMDTQYGEAALVMKEIHGEPDPEEPSNPRRPDGTGVAPARFELRRARGELVRERDEEREQRQRERHLRELHEQRERDLHELRELREQRERELREQHERELREQHERELREQHERELREQQLKSPIHVPTTNVQGGTDGGTSYQGVNSGSTPSGSTGSTSAGVGGAAAAGAAGAGLGAGMMKGGAISGPANAPSSGSVRGIGAGGRPGAAGSLTRGTTAAGPTARGVSAGARGPSATGVGRAPGASGASGAGSASRSAGAGGRAGAAGATGSSSTKGKTKSLFRRGTNGSSTGGRSNKKTDERSTERDALVYEQDWLGEDTAAPGVLD